MGLLASSSVKTEGVYQRRSFTNHIALCLLLLSVPIGQILVHTIAGSGIWHILGLSEAILIDNKQSIGLLFNLPDNLEYVSFALENKIGMHFMTNLFTTESHRNALFNLYFFLVGVFSNCVNVQPLVLMIIVSLFAAPLIGLMVFLICRQLELTYATSLWAVAMVILGSGPSWVLHVFIKLAYTPLMMGGVFAWIERQVDIVRKSMHLIDLFPVNSFLVYPYHSVALIFQIFVVSLILQTLRKDLTGNPFGWVLLSSVALALFALFRPYEAFVFSALLLLTMLVTRLARGKNLFFRFADYLTFALLVGPCLGYILWVSSLPVWNSLASATFTVLIPRKSLVMEFSVYWFFAAIGIFRVFKERRLEMLFLSLWAFSTMLLLIIFGHLFYKLAGGAVIAYGILGAFGLDYLFNHAVYRTFQRNSSRAILRGVGAVAAAILLIGTSLKTYGEMLHYEVPRIDTEVLSAARLIRGEYPNSIPVVLTDCSTAPVLVGLAAARVYSGHWAMTPDFDAKCAELAMAGFEDRPGTNANIGADSLRGIVAKVQPDFVLIRRGAWAEHWLLAHHAASVKNSMQRWALLAAKK